MLTCILMKTAPSLNSPTLNLILKSLKEAENYSVEQVRKALVRIRGTPHVMFGQRRLRLA